MASTSELDRSYGGSWLTSASLAWAVLLLALTAACSGREPVGFVPEKGCRFMYMAGNPTQPFVPSTTYRPLLDTGDYSCASKYLDVGTGAAQPNNLSYYGRGNAALVRRVRILLNVNERSQANDAHAALEIAATDLYRVAFNVALPAEIGSSIRGAKPGRWTQGKFVVELNREDWPTGKGYDINFVIRDPEFVRGN